MGTLLRQFLRKNGEDGYPSTLVSEGKVGILLRQFLGENGEGGYPSTLVSEGEGGKWVLCYACF